MHVTVREGEAAKPCAIVCGKDLCNASATIVANKINPEHIIATATHLFTEEGNVLSCIQETMSAAKHQPDVRTLKSLDRIVAPSFRNRRLSVPYKMFE